MHICPKAWWTDGGESARLWLSVSIFRYGKLRKSATDSFRLRDNVRVAIKPSSPARIDRPRAQHFHRESRGWKGRVGGLLREESRGRTTTRVRHTRQRDRRERGSGCITTTQEPYLSLWHFQMSRGLSGVPPVETLRYFRTNPARPWEDTRARASHRRHH